MKRHSGLVALSRDHHGTLVMARSLRRAAREPEPTRSAALGTAVEAFLDHWAGTMRPHFREEEEILLPAYARHHRLDRDPDFMRLLADHAFIRAQVERLAAAPPGSPAFQVDVAELSRILEAHVRMEEDVIFPKLESSLDEEEMKTLARRLKTPDAG